MKKTIPVISIISGTLAQLVSGTAGAEFFKDSKLSLSTRNFYYNQDKRNAGANTPGYDEWGQAFTLDFRSGFTEGVVGFGFDVLGQEGIRLDDGGRAGKAGEQRMPGSVFPLTSHGKAQSSFGHIGVTGKMRLSKSLLQLGMLTPKLPVVIAQDARLLAQMYQGGQITINDIPDLTLTGGKIEHSVERNSTDSNSLSIEGSNNAANYHGSNQFYYAGADYKASKSLLLQYYFGQLRDFYSQHFVGLLHNWELPYGSLRTDLRYFNSYANGKNASASGRAEGYKANGYWKTGDSHKGEVDNRLWSAMLTYDLAGHSMGLGFQKVTGKSDFPHLNQGAGRVLYLITNMQMHKFHNSGEKSWVGRYAYDFAGMGILGLKASVQYVRGFDINAAGSNHKEWERDTRLDYVFQTGPLKGLGLTWMYGVWRGNDATDYDENRLIANYTLSVF
mgnify:CR=1 FL=1